jgi:hypothetical protein
LIAPVVDQPNAIHGANRLVAQLNSKSVSGNGQKRAAGENGVERTAISVGGQSPQCQTRPHRSRLSG